MEWSVIVIARNEEAHVARCLASVGDVMRGRAHEIILVDSASTDRTAAIGRACGVTVVTLAHDRPLSPAAGRHAGFRRAHGDYLLFMDGDSILHPEWLAPALRALQDPTVGGVAGARRVVEAASGRVLIENQYEAPGVGRATSLGGPAAYTRAALTRAGGFNPFLRAYEEAELGARMRSAGYQLLRVPERMTTHFVDHRAETLRELWRRARAGYPYGHGQLVRHGLAQGWLAPEHLEGVGRLAAFAVLMLASTVGVVLLALGSDGRLLAAAALALAALYIVFAVRSRSLRKPLYYFLEWTIHGAMFARGLLMRPLPPERYPHDTHAPCSEVSHGSSGHRVVADRKKRWLAPIVIVLGLFGSLLVVTQGSALALRLHDLLEG